MTLFTSGVLENLNASNWNSPITADLNFPLHFLQRRNPTVAGPQEHLHAALSARVKKAFRSG